MHFFFQKKKRQLDERQFHIALGNNDTKESKASADSRWVMSASIALTPVYSSLVLSSLRYKMCSNVNIQQYLHVFLFSVSFVPPSVKSFLLL